ncbi:MAG: hypothetical protein ACRCYX_14360 [Dermatophilaceae bacterium]
MSVAEAVDPQSALVVPNIPDGADFVHELEMNFGFVLGHLVGFIRSAFGISLAEEIVTPLVGDWTEMQRAQRGWIQAADACDAVAENFSALPEQTAGSWHGHAGDAFRARMTSVSETYTTYGKGCRAVSELSSALVEGAKAAASAIALLIGFFAEILERLLLEASIPVAGWLVGAADVVIHIKKFWDLVNKGYNAIKKFLLVITTVVGAIETVVMLLGAITTTLRGMTAVVQAEIAVRADEAADAAFGA